MSARRAVVESVIEVDSAVELACARRAMPAAEPLDDTLLSVLPSRGRAIDAPVNSNERRAHHLRPAQVDGRHG